MSILIDNLKQDCAKIFLRSAKFIFENQLSISLKKRSVTLKKLNRPNLPLSIVIGFFSTTFRGQVVYSMDTDTGYTFAKKLMPNVLPIQQKEMVYDILGEIANMISGRASIELAGNSDTIHITPPVVIKGDSMNFTFIKATAINIILDSMVGSFDIDIAFIDNNSKS